MTSPLLKVERLQISFQTESGMVTPVQNVSFEMKSGEIVALVGESGCGKSVTSLSIMGLLDRKRSKIDGKILYKGTDLTTLKKNDWTKIRGSEISMIFQDPLTSLNPLLKIGDQITEAITSHKKMSKSETKKRCLEIIAKVGVPHPEKIYHAYPHTLSGGMRQRIMIAIALVSQPNILIADEPTTALDVSIQAQILYLMKDLAKEFDTGIIFITHDLGVVAEMADRVMVMYAGQVIEEGDVYSLFKNPKHPYTKGLIASTPTFQQEKEMLNTIEGVVPSPGNMPIGCRFYSRCAKAFGKCKTEMPPTFRVDNRHVRCWLYEEGDRS